MQLQLAIVLRQKSIIMLLTFLNKDGETLGTPYGNSKSYVAPNANGRNPNCNRLDNIFSFWPGCQKMFGKF